MQIGAYEVMGEVARGGMGVVYRARDTRLDREVALKVLLRAEDPAQVQRLVREAESLARLRHPHIVGVHTAQILGGRPVLILEWIEGESLQQRLDRDGPLPPREAAEIARTLAEALAYSHGQGVLHRDLKPANVLIETGGRVLLTDFGIAQIEEDAVRLTQSGAMLGSPQFWAPEQAAGKRRRVGPATDVHGVGATLYAALTGEPPFAGETLAECAIAALERTPKAPSSTASAVGPPGDPALDTICLRCLAKDPADRYPGAADLANALDLYLRGEGPRGRRRGAWIVAASAASLLAAGLGWRLTQSPAPETPPPAVQEPPEPPAVASSASPHAEELALHLQRARARIARRELDRAREACDQALALDPESSVAQGLRGAVLYLSGEREEGRRELDQALAASPEIPELQFHRGAVLALEGKRSEAVEAFTAALRLDPQDTNALLARAQCLGHLGRPEDAEADARKAATLKPGSTSAHVLLGALAVSQNRDTEAIGHFDRALAIAPDLHDALWQRATTHSKLDNRSAAVRDFSRAIELKPDYAPAWFNRATLRLRDEELHGAIEDYTECLRLDPKFIGALEGRGQAYARLKRLDEAEQDLAAFLQLRPTNAKIIGELAQVLFDGNKNDQAFVLTRRALELDAANVELWALHARILFRVERYRECIAAATRVLEAAADEPTKVQQQLLIRGWSYANLARYDEAEQDLLRCLDVLPPGHRLRPAVTEGLRRVRASRAGTPDPR